MKKYEGKIGEQIEWRIKKKEQNQYTNEINEEILKKRKEKEG